MNKEEWLEVGRKISEFLEGREEAHQRACRSKIRFGPAREERRGEVSDVDLIGAALKLLDKGCPVYTRCEGVDTKTNCYFCHSEQREGEQHTSWCPWGKLASCAASYSLLSRRRLAMFPQA